MSTPNPTYNAPAAYCRHCGKPLREEDKRDVRGMIFCEDCLTAVVSGNAARSVPPPPVLPGAPLPTSPGLAAVLAVFPGVGAMYNGQVAKGFAHVIILAALITMSNHAGGASPLFSMLCIAFWVYMIVDAYQTARARQLGLPLPDPFGLNNLFSGAPNVPGANSGGSQTSAPAAGQAAYAVPPQPSAQPDPSCSRQPVGAFLLIGLGAIFLLVNLGYFNHLIGRLLFPGLLIGLGVWLFVRQQTAVQSVNAPVSANQQAPWQESDSGQPRNEGETK